MKVPLFKPNLGQEELDALKAIFESGWIGLGPKVSELETAMAEYQGVKHAIGMNSCTAALHLAIEALDLPKGSQIIVPTITFASTAHAVEYCGHKVIFCESNASDLCIDVEDFERKVTWKTEVVIPVHMGGQPCNMEAIKEICDRKEIIVIEDVANAQGGSYKGKKLGSWGDIGCFSFEAKKNMTTGDGGMLITNSDQYIKHLKKMRWCGINKDTWKRFSQKDDGNKTPWFYEIDCLGYKYNMNDIAASIGLCQLKKLDGMNAAKRTLIKRYMEELQFTGDIKIPEYDTETGGYWLFIVQTSKRDDLLNYLGNKGITCGVHFMPIHMHPYYAKKYGVSLPQSEEVYRKIISLPLYPSMTEDEQSYVIENVKKFYQGTA